MTKRQKTGGRKAGTPNKITRELKEAILKAFEDVGGTKYLVGVAENNPAVFCQLLGKVLPMQVTGNADEDPIQVREVSVKELGRRTALLLTRASEDQDGHSLH